MEYFSGDDIKRLYLAINKFAFTKDMSDIVDVFSKEKNNQQERIWYSVRGPLIIKEMETSHIINCIEKIKRGEINKQKNALPWLEEELSNREVFGLAKEKGLHHSEYIGKIFTDQFIEENIKKIDWDLLCKHQELSGYILQKYKNKINWNIVYENQILPEEFILNNHKFVNWTKIIYDTRYGEDFLETWAEFIKWPKIAEIRKLSEYLIEKFYKSITFKVIFEHQWVSGDFIENHHKEFSYQDWSFFSKIIDRYSVDFILKFKDKIDWKSASTCKDLPLSLIEEVKDHVNWHAVCMSNKNLDLDFVLNFRDQIKFKSAAHVLKNTLSLRIKKERDIEEGITFDSFEGWTYPTDW